MTHLILDAEWENEKDGRQLEEETWTMGILDRLCEKNGLCVLKRVIHCFQPQGMTCLYLLAESHLSIHTWPESRFCAIDLFCCKGLSEDQIKEIHEDLQREFGFCRLRSQTIERSFPILSS